VKLDAENMDHGDEAEAAFENFNYQPEAFGGASETKLR
jgi:hypothetical protein